MQKEDICNYVVCLYSVFDNLDNDSKWALVYLKVTPAPLLKGLRKYQRRDIKGQVCFQSTMRKNSLLLLQTSEVSGVLFVCFPIFSSIFFSSLSHVIFQSHLGRHSHNKFNMHPHTQTHPLKIEKESSKHFSENWDQRKIVVPLSLLLLVNQAFLEVFIAL